ncbi:hypothetical protein BRC64_01420 [Halobacteriales archaeon QH_10_67_22]|nr:MAG: hypothetical protein BRC64_01420 [Halobacteriales archaeon QH_10_67_22]
MSRLFGTDGVGGDDDSRAGASDTTPQSFASVDATVWSRRLLPHWVRRAAVSVEVSTPRSTVPVGSQVPFTVTMDNALPVPVTIPVRSRRLWTWSVDGHVEAARVDLPDPPSEHTGFEFGRGERKQFDKRWDGMFQVSGDEWEPADPGEYTIGAGLNVDDAPRKGLYDETTVTLRPK